MDLFDMSIESLRELEDGRARARALAESRNANANNNEGLQCPTTAAQDEEVAAATRAKHKRAARHISSLPSSLASHFDSLTKGLVNLSKIPTLVIGVQSDALFPIVQQRELAEALRTNGNKDVVYYELDSPMGHDSFLLDVANVTAALKGFL